MKINEFIQSIDEIQSEWSGEGEAEFLFWLNTAFKTFTKKIIEVIDEKNLNIILEMAGYEVGELLHQYFVHQIEDKERLFAAFIEKYNDVGWGELIIDDSSKDQSEVIITYKNDWESKLDHQRNKNTLGRFYPGLFAGFYSEFFGTNVWYKILEHPLNNDDEIKLKIYPVEITPRDRMKELLSNQTMEEVLTLEALVEDRTRELQKLVSDLSSPIIPVLENIVVVPMIGRFDEKRSKELIEKTLKGTSTYQANIVIFDLTAMNKMNNHVITLLEEITQTIILIGATPIIVGVSPELSLHLVKKGGNIQKHKYFATLKHAVHYALALEGMQLITK